LSASYNFYEILGLSEGADGAEIKAAYRSLAMQYHPDKNQSPDAHMQFVAINAAYEVLRDPLKRRLYDLRRHAGQVISRRPASPTPSGPIDHEEMRRRYWASPEGQRKKREIEKEANFFDTISFYLRIISLPILAFLLLLLFDTFFTSVKMDQPVYHMESISMKGRKFKFMYQIGDEEFRIDPIFKSCIEKGDTVNVYKGRIFKLITAIQIRKNCDSYSAGESLDPNRSLFSGSSVLIYFALFLIAAIWFNRTEKHVSVGLGFFLIALTGVIVILFVRLIA